jgi:hypothetical protein
MLKAAKIRGAWPIFRSFPLTQRFKPLPRGIRIERYVIVFA